MTASLQEKKGKFFIVVSYKEKEKWKTKWVKTGLDIKGNKKKAKEMLDEFIENNKGLDVTTDKLLFSDFLLQWLENIKPTLRANTYYQYKKVIENCICPYFKAKKILLRDLTALQLQTFYNDQLKTVSANTVLKRHANIHKALDYAVGAQMIQKNVSDYVTLPRKDKFVGNHYDLEEVNKLFQLFNGSMMELPVKLAVYFGLRRSELLGLTWSCIDLKKSTIEIKATVVRGEDGLVFNNNTKNDSSRRKLVLNENMCEYLKKVKKQQKQDKLFYGNTYNENDFVCKWGDGTPFKPDYLSHKFKEIIESQDELSYYRFHDLRHSCASLLLSMGYNMKQIQEWLGHSTINTTANIYAHLNDDSKNSMAKSLDERMMI